MNQSQPLFVLKKYHSILLAAIIMETVSFVVSLTDSIVAGNLIGPVALGAIGLTAPFLTVATFLASIINSGTVSHYSYHIGQFNKRRAHEFFSQGIFLSLLLGLLFSIISFLLLDWYLAGLDISAQTEAFVHDYFNIIIFFIFLEPVTYVLENIVIADGGELLVSSATVLQIVLNIVLSVVLTEFWGVQGIALASVFSRIVFIGIICNWFFTKKSAMKLFWHWSFKDIRQIVHSGAIKSSTYALSALLMLVLNAYVVYKFGDSALVELAVAQKYLGLSTLFIGLSMAAQPLIGTLRGEKNTKAARFLIRIVVRNLLVAGCVVSVLSLVFAPFLVRAFGVSSGELFDDSVVAVRILAAFMACHAIMALFFVYYALIARKRLAFLVCLAKDFVFPLCFSILFAVLTDSVYGLWIGFSLAKGIVLLLFIVAGNYAYKKRGFPYFIPEESDDRIYIYDFEVNEENAVALSRTIDTILKEAGYPPRLQKMAALYAEELIMLILEKNVSSRKAIQAECTLILQDDGVRLILRDSGKIFDITDADASLCSFRQYTVSNMMIAQEYKTYIPTTGYNRNDFFFPNVKEPSR